MKKFNLLSTVAVVSLLILSGAPAFAQQASIAAQTAPTELPGLHLYQEAFREYLKDFELLADSNQVKPFKDEWEYKFDHTDDLATEEGTSRAIKMLEKVGSLVGCPEQPDYKCLYVRALRAYMQYHYSPDSPVNMVDPAQRAKWVAEWAHKFDGNSNAFKTAADALRAIRMMRNSLGMRFDYVQNAQTTTEEVVTRKAQFGGLGLPVSMNHKDDVSIGTQIRLLVHEPDSNSPAFGRVHFGDVIVKINDLPVENMTIATVKQNLVGKPGSQVKLTVRRGKRFPDVHDVTLLLTRAYTQDPFSFTPHGDTDAGVPIEFQGEDQLKLAVGFELLADEPNKGTPAEGKIKRGDLIVAVDGETLLGKTVNQAVALLRGEVDSNGKITVLRDGHTVEIPITRAVIQQHSVFVSPVGYGINQIHISSFEALNVDRDTATAIAQTVLPLASQALKALGDGDSLKKAAIFDDLKTKLDNGESLDDETLPIAVEAREVYEKLGTGGGIILDLTNNPGGDVGMVKSIVQMTLPFGQTTTMARREPGTNEIVVTESYLTPDLELVTVHQGDQTKANTNQRVPLLLPANMPFVVMINGFSASGSEWLAGVLQANHRAKLIGKNSRGKGEGQTGVDLPYGMSLHATDFEFFPGGMKSNWEGLIVDREVDSGDGSTNAPLAAAVQEVKELGAEQVLRLEAGKKSLRERHDFFDRIMRERAAMDAKPVPEQDPERLH